MKTTRHSDTALVIAKSTYLASLRQTLSLVVPPQASAISEWFVKDNAPDYRWLQRAWYRALLRRMAELLLPGVELHYAARKRLIEREVRAALARGVRQVVVVAGGFDTLTYRLHDEFRDVQFFELDHPATQSCKRQSLDRNGQPAANLNLFPADLTRMPLGSALSNAGVTADQPTVVVAEGVLMYLTTTQVEAIYDELVDYFRGPLTLITTFMVPDQRGRSRFHNASALLDLWLAVKREPFSSALSHEWLAERLGARRFETEFWDHERLRTEVLPDSLGSKPIAIGEHICVALRRETDQR